MNDVTRVKYNKHTGMSTKQFLGNEGIMLQSKVSTEGAAVHKVEDNGTTTVVEVVAATSLHDAKIKAKELLKKYGVKFLDELRNRNKEEVQ